MRLIKGKTYHTKPWYNSWRCMMSRCYREKDASYSAYGGRGIRVCDEWHDIQNFEKWVEENPFSKGMTLDRIDTDADYSPDNCRWATKRTQANNRRNTIYVEHNGEVHTISEWADITGINRSTLNNRYCRGIRGDRLFEKDGRSTIYIEWKGETHTIKGWSDLLGISKHTLSTRYYRGERGDRLFEGVKNRCHA